MTTPTTPAAPISSGPSNTPFLIAALACGVPAVVGLYWFFSPYGQESDPAVRVAVLIAAGVAYLAAAWLFTWPSRTRALTDPLVELPTALLEVKGQLIDLNAIKKEYNRYQSQLEGVVGQISQVFQRLAEEQTRRMADLDARQQAFDQIAADRRETERKVSEMQQQVARAAADVKKWEQSVVEFAQLLEQTSDPASGLSPEYQRAAARMTGYFAKAFGPFGLQLVSPTEGDSFDARVHQAGGVEEHASVPAGRVVRCIEWGFILRDEVRKAKVVVASEPVAPPPAPAPTATEKSDPAAPESTGGFEPIAATAAPPDAINIRKQTPARRNPA